ncbi:FecR family protein [Sunxiuqinia sp. A32]|uniref:FecR family protein n=1 Tax=Sunxiuqinia sp. A32 TaxID=3461496 RepID=UPI004045C0DD
MNKEKRIVELISGNLRGKEKEKILQEIEADSNLQEEYERVKNAWSLSNHNQSVDNIVIEKSWVNFRRSLKKKGNYRILHLLKYAAIILIIFSMGILSQKYFSADKNFLTKNELNQIIVPNGERAELVLADGSKVWLNSGTKLELPRSFSKTERRVRINGEAYFEVKKGKVPFIVSSNSGDIKVLGTSFNVRAYENMQFQTTLAEGSIQFNGLQKQKILKPGQQLTINNGHEFEIESVDHLQISSWKEGIISFDREPLQEVFKKLERHYDIQIIAPTGLSSIRFTGQIIDESIDEFMTLVDHTKPIKYQYDRKKRILTITELNR